MYCAYSVTVECYETKVYNLYNIIDNVFVG